MIEPGANFLPSTLQAACVYVGNTVEWGQKRARKQISVKEAEICQGTARGGGKRAQETFERLKPRGTFQEAISDLVEKQ